MKSVVSGSGRASFDFDTCMPLPLTDNKLLARVVKLQYLRWPLFNSKRSTPSRIKKLRFL